MNRPSHTTGALIVALGVFAFARSAAAQSSVYVSATGFADITRFGQRNFGYPSQDLSLDGTSAGGGVRIGTFLAPRVSLELSIDDTMRMEVSRAYPYPVPLIFPRTQVPDLKASTQFLTVSTLLAYHPPAHGRLRMGYAGGFTFVRSVYKSNDFVYVLAGATVTTFTGTPGAYTASPTALPIYSPYRLTQIDNTGGLTLGLEAAIDVTRHLAVVPEVRTLIFSVNGDGVWLIRPGVGVRWGF